jgi:hypothetical protein
MSIHLGFTPDPIRAAALDRRMHRELADSIAHLDEVSAPIVPHDGNACQKILGQLRSGLVFPPVTFLRYYQLTLALLAEKHEQANACWEALLQSVPMSSTGLIRPLMEPFDNETLSIFKLVGSQDAKIDIGILPPTTGEWESFRERYQAGRAMLEHLVPELAGEIQAIVHEVYVVAGDRSRTMQFDGGSHFQLWGGLYLNAHFHPTPQAIVEVIAHESAHGLLFGFCTDDPLVLNNDDELFRSPLRKDPRPMDGIYHATFVSARMHYALSALLERGSWAADERAALEMAREADRRNFFAGLGVFDAHGKPSELGRELMEGARGYMAKA